MINTIQSQHEQDVCLSRAQRYETHGPSLNIDGGVALADIIMKLLSRMRLNLSSARFGKISTSPMLKFLLLFLRSYCQQRLRSLRFEASARLQET